MSEGIESRLQEGVIKLQVVRDGLKAEAYSSGAEINMRPIRLQISQVESDLFGLMNEFLANNKDDSQAEERLRQILGRALVSSLGFNEERSGETVDGLIVDLKKDYMLVFRKI